MTDLNTLPSGYNDYHMTGDTTPVDAGTVRFVWPGARSYAEVTASDVFSDSALYTTYSREGYTGTATHNGLTFHWNFNESGVEYDDLDGYADGTYLTGGAPCKLHVNGRIRIEGTPQVAGTYDYVIWVYYTAHSGFGGYRYQSVRAIFTVVVPEAATGLYIGGDTGVDEGSATALYAVPSSSNWSSITWSSSNTSVATVSWDGLEATVRGVSHGTVTITATLDTGAAASVTVSVYWYAVLSYNANGGSGAPSSQRAPSTGTGSYSFTVSSAEPTRSGHEFLGWATSSDATSARYQPGGSVSVPYGSTTTLYAVWYGRVSSISISGSDSVYGAGSRVTLTTVFSPDGTSGTVTWTSSDESVATVGSTGTSVSVTGVAQGMVTITAVCDDGYGTVSATKTVYVYFTARVRFDLVKGREGPSDLSESSWTDSETTFTIPDTIPLRRRDTFQGWALEEGTKDVAYVGGDTITVAYGETVTLYAVWLRGKLTLFYDSPERGWSYMDPVYVKTYFGWRPVVEAYGKVDGVWHPLYGDHGHPEPVYTFVLRFDTLGGTSCETLVYRDYVDTHVFTIPAYSPRLSGWAFLGWAASEDAEEAEYRAGDELTVSAGITTLYAVWTEVPVETFSFVLSADGWEGTGPYTQSVAVEGVRADIDNVFFIAETADVLQRMDAENALLMARVDEDGTVTVRAVSTRPRHDVPVKIRSGGFDMEIRADLLESAWEGEGPWTQTVDVGCEVADAVAGTPDDATDGQVVEMGRTVIHVCGMEGTTVTLRAMEAKPTMDLAISIALDEVRR